MKSHFRSYTRLALILLAGLLFHFSASARKVYMTKGSDNGLYLNANSFSYLPGDTFVLKSSMNPFSYLSLENFHGTASQPIVIINEGGQVQLSAMAMRHCTFMKLTGTGSADQYGFYMTSPNQTVTSPAIGINGRSSDIEADHVDIYDHGYGFWVKEEASCDPTLQYPNWRLNNISIHDNRMRKLIQEGIYAGSTAMVGERYITCNGVSVNPLPIRLGNVKIYNNVIDQTGRGGIQLSGADYGANEIYNNTVTNAGFEFVPSQGNGIILGSLTTAYVHDNVVDNTFSTGIFSLGAGIIRIENNRIEHSGLLAGQTANGSANVMVDTRITIPNTNTQFYIKNNTFGSNTDGNIRVYNTYNTFATGNIICNNVTTTGSTNIVVYAPSVVNWVGCSGTNQPPTVSAGANQTITLPVSTVTLTGTATDADGTIASYAWSQVSGPSTAIISNGSSLSTAASALAAGSYVFKFTATDNWGATSSANVTITVNPQSGTPPPSSGSVIHIEAENFSSQSGIQTEPTSDVGGGRNVGAQDQGDWMDYSVNVPSSGLYTVSLRVATLYQTAQVQLKTSSGTILSTIDVPPSGGYQVWKTITATVNLTQGQQTLRLQTTSSPSGWNLNWWELAGGSTTTPTNQPPTVVAGAAQTITLPTSSVTLSGTATDADGTIASYQWSQVSGPAAATIASSTSASTSVTALVQGTYVFKLTATDNGGATGSDQVSVTVNPQATTPPSGGSTIHIEAENYTAMSGIQTENTSDVGGGKNVGYQDAGDWMEYAVNVPSAGSYAVNLRIATLYQTAQVQIKNAAGTVLATIDVIPSGGYQVWKTINATVTLPAGQQTLRLQTTSSPSGWNLNWWELLGGSTTSTNQAPTVNAGTAQTITLPTSAVTLTGTATDSDGTIASYQWSQLSGPNTASIAAAASASTSVSGLVQGSYVFKLTATDNQGASASAQVTITVNGTIVVPASTIHIEAENYSAQSGIQTEPTSDAGGGRNVGAQDAGDWMDYAVNVPATGTYTVSLRVATLYQQAQVQLKTSSGTVLSTINVAPTGGYQLWQTITATVNLTQGQQTLRLQTTQSPSGWNLNWWEITGPSSSAGTVSTQSTELTIDSTLSATSSVKIYPNPVQDNLTVRIDNTLTGKVKVEVLNLQGEVVKQYALNKTSKGVTQYYLSAATLAKGEYILKVTMNNFNQSTKIVKE